MMPNSPKIHDHFQDLPEEDTEGSEEFYDPQWGGRQLRNISFFKAFTDHELRQLYMIGSIKTLKPHAHAVIEGQPTRGLYLLLSGKAFVYKMDPATSEMTKIAALVEGSHFGEFSLFDSSQHIATVVADSVCFFFRLEQARFEKFLVSLGSEGEARFYKTCVEELTQRLHTVSSDYIISQQLLWKHALRR